MSRPMPPARGPTREPVRLAILSRWLMLAAGALALAAVRPPAAGAQTAVPAPACSRYTYAHVVALDQPIFYNRLGAFDPAAMIFALRRDVVPKNSSLGLVAGNVKLRDGKRPRPLVLRMNVGDCLQVRFQNLLAPAPVDSQQPVTRHAGVHVLGMQLAYHINEDGSWVGKNDSSIVLPNAYHNYTIYAEREGTYLLYSTGANTGGEGNGGQLARGLFGAVNVEPRGSEWYRSQLTADELRQATVGTTPGGQPIIKYDATYPGTTLPILKMMNGNEIVHADLNAIITGPGRGPIQAGTYPEVRVSPERHKPFREFTIVFHDEVGLRQAFPAFDDGRFRHTLHGGRDAFAINYGTGGVGAEVIANRFRVGPMHACNDCKFEEFFLTSWAVGDPAMVVDVPANTTDPYGNLITGPKATRAFFPDDPSNVYHAYMNDHVKFRNLHAGPKEHHIFHLHAHQWLHTPDHHESTYLDSQLIGPGSGYTYEIAWGGAGNRNKTPGDAIFHCHFYPHFAMGMWALFRVHDVLETGTVLDSNGRPVAGARALPDGEIAAGTPIPAVVPIPGEPLAPMPNAVANNPGYPFYIPGVAGHRPPKPPLDTRFDGGLPRHVVRGGTATFPPLNRFDFHKHDKTLQVQQLPNGGTAVEQAAMNFHAIRNIGTWRVDPVTHAVSASSFTANGRPPAAGAPYAEPCVREDGTPDHWQGRQYKGAAFQTDPEYNKAGWHYPQHRMFALWHDVIPTRSRTRPPEPMFLRTHSRDCIDYSFVNLVPHEYELDDFQVRTPTDVIGQHIHLVKFDVTSSDGSANGFNYEDGSLSPQDVFFRIRAIRAFNQCTGQDQGDWRDGTITCPVAKPHPFFGVGPDDNQDGIGDWIGAQETVQRWYADEVPNNQDVDRTLRNIFTHDHFGPSTHQQAGLYAGLVAELPRTDWRDPETGVLLSTGRSDGGPTSWRADIINTADPTKSFREFNLLFQDFALAYRRGSNHARRWFTDKVTGHSTIGIADTLKVINPPGKFEDGLPYLLQPPRVRHFCPNPTNSTLFNLPCPELISVEEPGTFTVNYRNEPIAMRVRDPANNSQATGPAGDLAFAFSSTITNRADPDFNQVGPYAPLTGDVRPSDPFTPLFRAYQGDQVHVKVLVGAHEEGHNFSFQAVKWLFEPSFGQSGYRASQAMGISEHFEFELPRLAKQSIGSFTDYLYRAGTSTDALWNGIWGLMRTYRSVQQGLLPLPNNQRPDMIPANVGDFNEVCPKTAYVRRADVTAARALDVLPLVSAGGVSRRSLIYNPRTFMGGPLHDPNALLYVRTGDLDAYGRLKPGIAVEPLVLRAAAGDCIEITLRNRLPAALTDHWGFTTLPMVVDSFNMNQLVPSSHVGLSPQLNFVDVTRSDGINVGWNPVQTVPPGPNSFRTLRWYAGELFLNPTGDWLTPQPIEWGALNILPADPIKQPVKGLFAAQVIEPAGAWWAWDTGAACCGPAGLRRQAATVYLPGGGSFREFVTVFQSAVNMQLWNGMPIPNQAEAEDAEDSGQKGVNYRTEPMWFRFGFAADKPLRETRLWNFSRATANVLVGGDPQTPVFLANVGSPFRFRVLHAGGTNRQGVFQLHGHVWQELPFGASSFTLGNNAFSEFKGSQEGLGSGFHFNVLARWGAGGAFRILGDYLFRDQASYQFDAGRWGILRVLPASAYIPITAGTSEP